MRRASLAAATLVLTACGGPTAAAPEAAAPTAAPSAGASASLAPTASAPAGVTASPGSVEGKLFGRPFVARAAYAKKTETAGEAQIWILDHEAPCAALVKKVNDLSPLAGLGTGTVFVRATVPWKAGEPTPVFDYTAAAYVNAAVSIAGRGVRSGTLELVTAPTTPGATGRLRIEVQSYTAGESAKGEMDFTVCP